MFYVSNAMTYRNDLEAAHARASQAEERARALEGAEERARRAEAEVVRLHGLVQPKPASNGGGTVAIVVALFAALVVLGVGAGAFFYTRVRVESAAELERAAEAQRQAESARASAEAAKAAQEHALAEVQEEMRRAEEEAIRAKLEAEKRAAKSKYGAR